MTRAGAVDIGGTRVKVGVVADDGSILSRGTFPTPKGGDPAQLVDGIVKALTPLLAAASSSSSPSSSPSSAPSLSPSPSVVGVGVSVAGFLDRDHSRMIANANLPALVDYPLRDSLRDALKLDVVLEVDSNASTIAEYRFGAGVGSKRLLGVTIGTGLGGGVIVDGHVLRHTGECAGDLGHIIVHPDGRPCSCGAKGCLEAMVCSAALSERAGGRSVREVVTDAHKGGTEALDAIHETARWLGIGLASLAPLFAPDRVVVGGGVAAAGDLMLEPARSAFHDHAGDDFRDSTRIVGSTFGGWEGMVGAASEAFIQP